MRKLEKPRSFSFENRLIDGLKSVLSIGWLNLMFLGLMACNTIEEPPVNHIRVDEWVAQNIQYVESKGDFKHKGDLTDFFAYISLNADFPSQHSIWNLSNDDLIRAVSTGKDDDIYYLFATSNFVSEPDKGLFRAYRNPSTGFWVNEKITSDFPGVDNRNHYYTLPNLHYIKGEIFFNDPELKNFMTKELYPFPEGNWQWQQDNLYIEHGEHHVSFLDLDTGSIESIEFKQKKISDDLGQLMTIKTDDFILFMGASRNNGDLNYNTMYCYDLKAESWKFVGYFPRTWSGESKFLIRESDGTLIIYDTDISAPNNIPEYDTYLLFDFMERVNAVVN